MKATESKCNSNYYTDDEDEFDIGEIVFESPFYQWSSN